MKSNIKGWLLLLLLVLCLGVSNLNAQSRLRKHPEYHYFTISGSGGYSSLLSDYPKIDVKGFAGATFGLGYEYHYRAFWLSLGVEAQLLNSRFMLNNMDTIHMNMLDTEGDPMTYHYVFNKWQENQMAVYVNIPFMIGFSVNRFYMGVGAKAGMNFYGKNRVDVDYLTAATYDRFLDDFENMPNHFYQSFKANDEKPFALKPNVAAIAEIGYEVVNIPKSKKNMPMILKVAAYGEYGLMNVYDSKNELPLVAFNKENPAILQPSSYLMHVPSKGFSTTPFYVGVKLTLMFELPLPQKCHCLQTERGASWRNDAPREVKKLRKQMKRNKKQKSVTNNNKK